MGATNRLLRRVDRSLGKGGERERRGIAGGDFYILPVGDTGPGDGSVERRDQVARGEYPAQGVHLLLGRLQAGSSEAAAVGNVDGPDRGRRQRAPDAQPVENLSRAFGQGQHAGIPAHGSAFAGFEDLRIDAT
jgi:hypothetical protein